MISDKYKITFVSYLEGATEQEIIIDGNFLIEQLKILKNSDYTITKVKLMI